MPELPTPGTIKRRLFDDLLAHPDLTPDELAKRHGLNGHDMVKNLEQLRQHGFIETKLKDEHIISVRVRNGVANMAMLERPKSAISLDQSEHAAKLAGAISKLPWLNAEWRVWEPSAVANLSGLKPTQVVDALRQLREQGRLQQLGGGGRGKRIQGVRWKGERRPDLVEAPAVAVSATEEPAAPSGPSLSLRDRYPQAVAMVDRWKAATSAFVAFRAVGMTGWMELLDNDPEVQLMRKIGPDVERLLKKVQP